MNSIHGFLLALLLASTLLASITASASDKIIQSHAITTHGTAKYPENFKRFDYTSENAQKGGVLRLAENGTFNSLNPFITKGNPADNLDLIYDSLLKQSLDEPFTKYGLLAHKIEYPEDRSWVIFHLRPEAVFHDDHPITAEDVVYTFDLLLEKGNPRYQFYYADVESAEVIDELTVKFSFKNTQNKELALIIGELPVLPKHYWHDKEFDTNSLEPPLGSGPYQIKSINAGRSISFQRLDSYWAKDLPVNAGFYNFDQINVDYYRDNNVAIEALKANEYDFRWENSSKFWSTAYDIPSVEEKKLIKEQIKHNANKGMQAFVFNLRKPIFQDIQLRKAISFAFDFEWSNQALFYNVYKRAYSFHSNSNLASSGLPTGDELALLTPFKNALSNSVFSEAFKLPVSEGNGRNRPNLRKAKKLLDNAGYYVKKNQLFNKHGQAINFEILLASPGFERIVNPFIKNLQKLGIYADIRLVDSSQYINRKRSFDFDMVVHVFSQSESPGNEQKNLWGSLAADTKGSGNLSGIKLPVIDQLIKNLTLAKNREELITANRALDRVLLHQYFSIPQWYSSSVRVVYWNKFSKPELSPVYDRYFSQGIHTWWLDPDKAAQLISQK